MSEPLATASYPGIEIAYYESPYRHYLVNEGKVPSVSQALGIINKPALMFYAEKVTLEGTYKMLQRAGYTIPGDVTAWKRDLKRFGYDHRSQTNNAAARGVDVHAILQAWVEEQKIPNARDYPPDRRGYIRALSKFLMEHSPEFSESEVMVGSVTHGFAGRMDTAAVMNVAGKGRCLLDAKTSKRVYPNSHFPQLRGYRIGRIECGLDPTDNEGILRLGADGEYELAWSDAEDEDFLAPLRCWKTQQKWARR